MLSTEWGDPTVSSDSKSVTMGDIKKSPTIVVARHGVAGVAPGADRHVYMNGSVGTKNNADNSMSANNNSSGNDILDHIKFCNPHGKLKDTSLS